MRVTSRISSLFVSALSQSMPVDLMQNIARMVIPDYDIYERSGFPSAIGMPRADAARHILKDFAKEGFLVKFVEALITVTSQGYMSREVRITQLPRIIAEVEAEIKKEARNPMKDPLGINKTWEEKYGDSHAKK